MVALTVKASGEVSFYEMYLENEMWKEHTVNYYIEKLKLKQMEIAKGAVNAKIRY